MAIGREKETTMKISDSDQRLLSKLFVSEEKLWQQESEDLKGVPSEPVLSETPLKTTDSWKSVKFLYFQNTDLSIRWIIPAQVKEALFLHLYNGNTWKAKLGRGLVKSLYHMKGQQLAADGSFWFYYQNEDPLASQFETQQYAIFTGTVGPNRKAIAFAKTECGEEHFFKIPLNDKSAALIKNEHQVLRHLNHHTFDILISPKSSEKANGIRLSNGKQSGMWSSNEFSVLHLQALAEMYEGRVHFQFLSESRFWSEMEQLLAAINPSMQLPASFRMKEQLLDLREQLLSKEYLLPCSMAHGDFTPWNMYRNQSQLYCYDWELSMAEAPLLFDLFHFVMQTEVLVHHADYGKISQMLHALSQNSAVRRMCQIYEIDFQLHFRCYLLYQISYYLNLYLEQGELHQQAHWLLKVWEEALREENLSTKELWENDRMVFIRNFFPRISNKAYAVLKAAGQSVSEFPSTADIDMVIDPSEFKSIKSLVERDPTIKKCQQRKFPHLIQLFLYFEDESFLQLDFILHFQRKSITFLSAREVLQTARTAKDGVKYADVAQDWAYIYGFYTLNGANIPVHYQNWFNSLLSTQRQYINRYFQNNFNCHPEPGNAPQYVAALNRKQPVWKRIPAAFRYLVYLFKSLFWQPVLWISFSGVDGAGKSTIIEEVAGQLRKKYRQKVVVRRHRPSILPILSRWSLGKRKSQEKVLSQLPRKGKNQSFWASLMRFSYYYLDYLLGQWWVWLKAVLSREIVLYDRYYFDFMSDPKRSNLVGIETLAQWGHRWLRLPQLNFFLYAPAEVILQRKQELSQETIETLTANYKQTFDYLGKSDPKHQYLCLSNISKEDSVEQIMQQIIKKL
ncbi:hypothetical protein PEDI_18290 [Persicobacter diffluens]|uniref:Thymidylate kinase-like domain-containing protein n=2 Tax=Persicobacter diffluens TaxID=981 RepID=A0AAN4VYW0_9BACT|nr:hypothetical protein PEDI_18290 [Persicobacter diffluens]